MTQTLDIYIRVSQVGGRSGESFQSPGDQEAVTRAAMARAGFEVGEVNTEDLDKSGGTDNRPGFQRVLARIESGQSDGVAVIRADRFARSVRVAADCLERIKEAGGVFYSATESIDLLSPSGRFQFNVLMAMSQYQRDLTTEQWQRAQANALERNVPPGRIPFGYARERVKAKGGKTRFVGPLVPDAVEAPVVRRAYELRGQGNGWASIAQALTALHPPRHGRAWAVSSTAEMIQNRVYLGELHRGGHEPRLGSHEPLVTVAEWEAANRARSVKPAKKTDWLLHGFLRCAGCRYTLTGKTLRGSRLYRCSNRHAGGVCPAATSVNAGMMEAWLLPQLRERHALMLEGLEGAFDLAEIKAGLSEAEAALATLATLAATSKRPDLYAEGLAAAEHELAERQAEFDRAQRLSTVDGVPMLFSWDEVYDEADHDTRRQMIDAMVDCVMVRRGQRGAGVEGRALVLWRGEAPADLPRRGRYVPLASFDWPEDVAGVPALQEVHADAL